MRARWRNRVLGKRYSANRLGVFQVRPTWDSYHTKAIGDFVSPPTGISSLVSNMVKVLVKRCGHHVHGVCAKCQATIQKRVVAYLTKNGIPKYPPSEVHVALGAEARHRLLKALKEDGID